MTNHISEKSLQSKAKRSSHELAEELYETLKRLAVVQPKGEEVVSAARAYGAL